MFRIIARRIPAPMATWGKASGRRNLKSAKSAHYQSSPLAPPSPWRRVSIRAFSDRSPLAFFRIFCICFRKRTNLCAKNIRAERLHCLTALFFFGCFLLFPALGREDSSARQHNDTGPGTANSSSEPAPHPSETSSRCATGMCQTAHRFEPPNSGLGGLHLPARAAGAHLAMRMRTERSSSLPFLPSPSFRPINLSTSSKTLQWGHPLHLAQPWRQTATLRSRRPPSQQQR